MAELNQKRFSSVERRLQADLDESRLRFKEAMVMLDQKTKLAYELGLNTKDGSHAIHSAVRVYLDAVAKYRRAVHRLGDFTIERRLPDDE